MSVSIITYLIFSFQKDQIDHFHSQFYTEGYNFRQYRDGEKIDISHFEAMDGSRLLDVSKEELLLLFVVDPMCSYTKLSRDVAAYTKQTTDHLHMGYYPVMFVPNPHQADLTKYAAVIGFNDVFKWDSHTVVNEHFKSMPTPAHILVNREGLILQVWFCSDRNEEVRKRMSS
ncbi:MAG TPA: hypothetical protein VGO50_19605 [Pyrinomonadaceae bacterium]|nr:hypothetical protein [Pyrinomonadaceae bacterium]